MEEYEDNITGKTYKPGQTWMIRGPIDMIPSTKVEIVEDRKAIPLSENEGVYVRDLQTGEVNLVRGPRTFLLGERQAWWEKPMVADVERLLNST